MYTVHFLQLLTGLKYPLSDLLRGVQLRRIFPEIWIEYQHSESLSWEKAFPVFLKLGKICPCETKDAFA